MKFVFGSSSIANLGLFGKLKVQFKYWWVAATKSANASLQYQPVLFLTLPVHYSNKQAMNDERNTLEMRQACLKGLISKEYPLTRSDRCN